MPDRVTGPLGPRRHIAAALRQLREDSGKLLHDVAGELMISTSKLSRLENAQGKPLPRDIRDLTRYYGIQGTPLADRLQEWLAAAQRRGWWTDFDDEVLEGLDAHLAYEIDASVERTYTLPFVPALLQTDDYARAAFAAFREHTEGEIRQLLAVRKARRRALRQRDDLPPLQLVAVTHESTLRQGVGSPEILRNQLETLLKRSEMPNVSLHVLPFSAPPVFSMTTMYAYFEYQGAGNLEKDVVHIETHAGFWSIEDPGQVLNYREAHNSLVEASLDENESRALIRQILSDGPSR